MIANTTTVMMPERWSRSAIIQTPKVERNCAMTAVGTSWIRGSVAMVIRERTAPSTILPRHTTKSSGTALQPEKIPVTAATTASR
jgi:hypothetical protein